MSFLNLLFGRNKCEDVGSLKNEFENVQKSGCLLDCNVVDFINGCKNNHIPSCVNESIDRKCLEDHREREFKRASIKGDTSVTSSYLSYLNQKRKERFTPEPDEAECPVCLSTENVDTLSCGHRVHKNCVLQTAIALGVSQGQCPLCRKVLPLSEIPVPQRSDTRILRDSEFRDYDNSEALGLITREQRIQRENEYLEYERQSEEIQRNPNLTQEQKDEQIQDLYQMMIINRTNREQPDEEEYLPPDTQMEFEDLGYQPPYSPLPGNLLELPEPEPDNYHHLAPNAQEINEYDIPMEDWILELSQANIIPPTSFTTRLKNLNLNVNRRFIEQATTGQMLHTVNFTDLYFVNCLLYPFLLEDLNDMRLERYISQSQLVDILQINSTHPIDHRYNIYTIEQLYTAITLFAVSLLFCVNKIEEKRDELFLILSNFIIRLQPRHSDDDSLREWSRLAENLLKVAIKMNDEEMFQAVYQMFQQDAFSEEFIDRWLDYLEPSTRMRFRNLL